jgi:hypothetical protein
MSFGHGAIVLGAGEGKTMRNSKADLRRRDEMARATAPYVHSRKPTMAELGTKDAAAGPCHYHLPQLQ